jgi:hypothetical protein
VEQWPAARIRETWRRRRGRVGRLRGGGIGDQFQRRAGAPGQPAGHERPATAGGGERGGQDADEVLLG